jgi:hypothetical protein
VASGGGHGGGGSQGVGRGGGRGVKVVAALVEGNLVASCADFGKIILKMILDQVKIIFSKTILDQIIFFQRNDLDLRS